MYVKPVLDSGEGGDKLRAVPFPATRSLLPVQGADVPETQYWLKRLEDGDVVPCAANGGGE